LLHAEAIEMVRDHQNAVLKLIVTRGVGGRGYRQPPIISPTRLFSVHPHPNYPVEWSREGVTLRLCQKRLSLNPDLSGIKHLNRLEQILARAEWSDDGIQEGLMLDAEQQVVEGTMSNLFVVNQGELLTPRLDRCGIAGIVRGLILDAAEALCLNARETRLSMSDLQNADELFLSNSIIGIWPVKCFEQRNIAVGPVTRRLQAWYKQLREQAAYP
jgi:4-amino-4-deoxychorismate lyase